MRVWQSGTGRLVLAVLAIVGVAPATVGAQSVNVLATPAPPPPAANDAPAPRQPLHIAVPAGATAGVGTDDAGTGAGPLLGFQIYRRDSSFLGVFFTFAPEDEIKGDERNFGAFLQNPPLSGTSFSAEGNKLWTICRRIYCGVSGRTGVTRTRWTGSLPAPTATNPAARADRSVSGEVSYLTIGALFMSPTFEASANGNEYQFGVEFGVTNRWLLGDLGADESKPLRQAILGTGDRQFGGVELTFFARLNQAQPFFRVSNVGSGSVDGFQGWQTSFGIKVLSALFQDTMGELEINELMSTPATVGVPIEKRQFTVKGGRPPYAWTVVSGMLPPGLDLSSGGTLSGTPSIPGPFDFTLRAVDAQNLRSKEKTFSISVAAPAPASR